MELYAISISNNNGLKFYLSKYTETSIEWSTYEDKKVFYKDEINEILIKLFDNGEVTKQEEKYNTVFYLKSEEVKK